MNIIIIIALIIVLFNVLITLIIFGPDPIIEILQTIIKSLHKTIKKLESKCKSRGQKIYELFSEDKNFIDSLLNIIIIILALVIAYFSVFQGIYWYIYSLFPRSYYCPAQKWEWIRIIFGLPILFVLIKFVFFDLIAQKIKKLRLFLFFLFGFLLVKVWSTSCTEQSNCAPENFLICKISSVVCNSMNFFTANNILKFTNIIQTITIILIVIILCLFYRELSRPSGIVIQPFEYEQLDKEKKLLVDGKFIAELLAAELHHIEHIYNSLEDGQLKIKPGSSLAAVCREDINFPLAVFKGDNLETAFSAMGSISVPNQLSLQIGSLLLTLKQLWPQGTVQIISGRIKRDNLSLQITARYEKSNHKSEVHAYKVPSESTELKTPPISDLIEELAYRIVLDLSPKISKTSSWKAFKFYTQALYCICQYERTKSAKKLDDARTLCEDASRIDKNFSKLGDLLSLIGFYYLGADQYLKAESTLKDAMKINPNSYLVLAVYGHKHYYLGDYNTALEYYTQAKNLEPSRYEFYIRIGVLNAIIGEYEVARESLETSQSLEFQNHAADSALAWIDFLTYLKELGEQEKPKEQDAKTQEKLDSAYNILERMEQEKNNIDYSNLAVVLLYRNRSQKFGESLKKVYEYLNNYYRAINLKNIDNTLLKSVDKKCLKAVEENLKEIDKEILSNFLPKIQEENINTVVELAKKLSKIKKLIIAIQKTLKKPDEETLKKAHENWERAFELCPDETISDQLKRIFYEYLVNLSEVEQTNEKMGLVDEDRNIKLDSLINKINTILKYRIKDILPQALISDLIKDAKIILFNCIADHIKNDKKNQMIDDILSNKEIKLEGEYKNFCAYEIISKRMCEPMEKLINTLEQYITKKNDRPFPNQKERSLNFQHNSTQVEEENFISQFPKL